MALVTIITFNHVHEAELARTALESEGIEAIVLDRFTGDRLFGNASGGVRLQVEENDVDAADAVLNRMAGVAGAEEATPSAEEPWQPPQTCPSCGASDVARRQKWVAFFIVAAFVAAISYMQEATLLGFFIVVAAAVVALVAASWRCRACGFTW
jgi:Putative prokaryotic signal transducing protein